MERPILRLAAARAINTMGFSMVMPFMAMYIVEQRGGRGVSYGAIYLCSGLAAAVSQAVSGELADRKGRRVVMLTALVLRALNMVALGAAVLLHAGIFPLAVLIVLNGVLRAQFEPAASAAVTDACAPDQRVAAFGVQRMGVNLGWALGPALGGALAQYSYGTLFFFAAAATIGAAALVAGIPESGRRHAEPAPRISLVGLREHRAFAGYLILVFLGSIMTVQLFSTLSVFAKTELHVSRADIGLLYTVNGAFVVLFQIPAIALIDRGGLGRALVFGPILYTLAYLGIGASASFWPLAGAVAVLTAGEVVFAPALSDVAAHLGDARRLGRAFGLFGLMQQLGQSMGPLAGGLVYDHLRRNHMGMWGIFAAGMAAVGCGYLLFARRWKVV